MIDFISIDYRAEQVRMHDNNLYGKSGGKWWNAVMDFLVEFDCTSWLDYGCGTGRLASRIRRAARPHPDVLIREYDPGVRGRDLIPTGKFHLVTCVDVLEHVEPDYLRNVLEHLNMLTAKALFVVISTRPAGKSLSDGRNAHLIVEHQDWWRNKLIIAGKLEVIRDWVVHPDEWCVLLRPAP